ncbi:uncharacterized protein LOC117513293 [Thalassophryne amazonica]|uniref:uncharacterized protein LOC117513293 n=1 Tax=Thalassophryne amazonica TaxID=390379 RepID=UPI001471F786|nr:uncharacterized protein LOC117513293 [Thalassophryne amazonica]XP_034029430.1 uncharacterized protein LOC117513293 [Thalassophryne amazonica]
MPAAVTKDAALTIYTVTADSKNMLPPLCQLLKALCCSAECCSRCLRFTQPCVTAALGTIQIMFGLFNIGLGPGRTSLRSGDFASLGAAYWLGSVYIVTGILSLLAGQCPTVCLVGFTVFMNISGAIFAITGIALYAIDLGDASVLWMCSLLKYSGDYNSDNCANVAFLVQSLLTSMDATLIILAVLQLCVNISLAVLGIKALIKKDGEVGKYPENQQTQLKEVIMTSPGA